MCSCNTVGSLSSFERKILISIFFFLHVKNVFLLYYQRSLWCCKEYSLIVNFKTLRAHPQSTLVLCAFRSLNFQAFFQLEDRSEMLEKIPQIAIDEMCRYGASELHVIASLIGGITAQEVIKLITHQYICIDNTFVFDGHTQHAQTYRL